MRTCFIIAISCLFCSVAHSDDHRDNGQMIELVRPVCKQLGESVVQVRTGNRTVALGTVVSADGYVLTKRSELNGDPITVRLGDGRLFPARVAAVRRRNDLALLGVDTGFDLKPVEFSDESPLIASFLVSVGRSARPIGIGVVGASERKIDPNGRLGVRLTDDSQGRALVDLVVARSGAAIAGIEPGDRIVAINGEAEDGMEEVVDRLRGMFAGEKVKLTILRPNDMKELVKMEMDAGISELGIIQESENDSKVNGPRNVRLSGFELVMQHDTVLDPDECGGPVVNLSGQVVGLNIARAGRVVTYSLPAPLVVSEMVGRLEEARSAIAK